MTDVTRRMFMQAAGLAASAVGVTAPASVSPVAGRRGSLSPRAVSSANGQQATKTAVEMMLAGKDPLEAVVAGVAVVEDDPEDTSVGYGGLPNERGVVELDGAVMHGPSHRAGAVASLRNIRHPAQVAMKVLKRTDHVLLVGEGALQFALAHGFTEENLLTEKARRIWLRWKENLSNEDDWLPDPDDPETAAFFRRHPHHDEAAAITEALASGQLTPSDNQKSFRFRRPTGTIHCGGINSAGDLSCTTTTSGLAFKIPGRVGDSPIIGAGLYCDNNVGSCGSTGRGEANLQNMCSFAAVELMRNGASPEEAGMEVLRRVAATTEDRLRDSDGRPDFGLSFYLLAKDGRYAGVSMWGPARYAVTDSQGTRLEASTTLYTRAAE
ncbi:MAG: N(4)-(beta-N-acetylglucosaminyl)-L-asparaginase [Planctomycetaceae bacterium]|nr:N(4)-(beta-N-acetylglucosaminyl)-L-asparaginase [Planctomycetaceae bacterium]